MKAVFFDIKPSEREYLEKHSVETIESYFYKDSLNPNRHVPVEISDAEIISVFIDSTVTKNVMEKFPNLKYIILRSVGYSHVDLSFAKERGISIFNAPHYGDYSIAEYTFALLLAVSRKIAKASRDVKEQTVVDEEYQGIELNKKTIGIVGLGAIGKKVAEIAKSFSMNVIYHDIKKEEGYNYTSFDELCRQSDIISINCPLNSKTLYMFDRNRFETMKNGVIIINTARGEIIKTTDLYDALLNKKVAFAALDVVECENIFLREENNKIDINSVKENCLKNYYVTRKLLNMQNVIITPHIAYNTKEARQRILEITVENLISSTKFTNSAKNLVLV